MNCLSEIAKTWPILFLLCLEKANFQQQHVPAYDGEVDYVVSTWIVLPIRTVLGRPRVAA